jgi:dienelactone hydrolase
MTQPHFLSLGLLLLLTLAAAPVLAQPPAASAQCFESGGKRVRVDLYEPVPVAGPRPMIVVLYGAGGILNDGPDMRRLARRLAEAGNAVAIVHYFNRTGTVVILRDAIMRQHFDAWLDTVRAGIRWARARQGRDAAPIGVYGYSLGAFLALAAASDNPDVGAVVEQAGGIWYGQSGRLRRLPPVLLMHGESDRRVAFDKYPKALLALLRPRGSVAGTRFFPGEGHRFGPAAREQAHEEVVRFFARKLRPARTAGTAHLSAR